MMNQYKPPYPPEPHCHDPHKERPIFLTVDSLNGGSANYSLLQNKPMINGHTLVGNRTSQELGIPVKASDLVDDGTYVKELVQSDWNEDDPSAPAYIKNRPFFTGLIDGDTIINKSIVIRNYTVYGYGYKEQPVGFLYKENTPYVVNWDGAVYKFTAELKDGYITIGDINTAPYIRSYTYKDIDTGDNVLIIDYPSDADANHTVKITEMVNGVKKMSSEYLPDDLTGDTLTLGKGTGDEVTITASQLKALLALIN